MMQGIRSAVYLTTAERYFGLITNFVTMAIVSRLLTPAEVSVAVVGWAILSIPYAFRDLGTMSFIVHCQGLTDELTRTATSVCMLSAAVLVLILHAAAPWIGKLYGDPQLTQFLTVAGFAVLTDSVGSPQIALLQRDLAFSRVACVNLTLAVVTLVVSVGFALAGFSYMSIAWAALLGNGAATLVAIALNRKFWIYHPRVAEGLQVTGFGLYYSTMASLMRAYEATPYLALGWFAPTSAAYFNRAFQLCQLPDKFVLSGVVSVAFPALSAYARQGGDLKKPYLQAVSYVTAVQWPALLMIVCLAPLLIAILYGSQWSPVVPLVQILALAYTFGVVGLLTYPVLYATGNLRAAMRVTMLSLPVSALIMISAAAYGPTILAFSLFIALPLNSFVALSTCGRLLGFGWHDIWVVIRKSLIVAMASAVGPLAVVVLGGMSFNQTIPTQVAMVVLSAGGWGLALWLTKHPIMSELVQLGHLLRERLTWGNRKPKGCKPPSEGMPVR